MRPKEIIIEHLNSFSDKSEHSDDKYSERTKYLNTMSSNFETNFNPINTSPGNAKEEHFIQTCKLQNPQRDDLGGMKRNSTVKELRKQQLIETQSSAVPAQSMAGKSRGKKKSRKYKKRINKKRLRDLSQGNQVVYKGTRGFEFVKLHRKKRRNESCQFRQLSVGSNGVVGSVRSRNKSSEWFSSVRSCSSGCGSDKGNRSRRFKSQTGFFTRNRLNAKFRAITEERKQRIQNTLGKVMKIHANHAEQSDLSRKSSHVP